MVGIATRVVSYEDRGDGLNEYGVEVEGLEFEVHVLHDLAHGDWEYRVSHTQEDLSGEDPEGVITELVDRTVEAFDKVLSDEYVRLDVAGLVERAAANAIVKAQLVEAETPEDTERAYVAQAVEALA
jgi:Lon protease-like protein